VVHRDVFVDSTKYFVDRDSAKNRCGDDCACYSDNRNLMWQYFILLLDMVSTPRPFWFAEAILTIRSVEATKLFCSCGVNRRQVKQKSVS